MTFRRFAAIFLAWAFLVSGARAILPEDLPRYRQGLHDFHAGRYSAARDAFQEIAPRNPDDKKLQRLLARSRVKAAVEGQKEGVRKAATAQARLLLDMRRSVLEELNGSFPDVRVTPEGTGTRFSFPEKFLFPQTGVDPSPKGEAALGLVKDYIQTHRTVFLTLLCEHGPQTDEDSKNRNRRRTIALAAFLFRQVGLAPTQIRLTERAGKGDIFHVLSDTIPPAPDPSEPDLEGVLIAAKNTIVDLDRGESVKMEISILEPSGILGWAVKIVRLEDGTAVRNFSGTSDVWASLPWDGRDNLDRLVAPGLYRAFLTARAFTGVERTDSLGLVVRQKKTPVSPRPSPPAPRPEGSPRAVDRQWAYVIGFPFNGAGVVGGALVDLRQLAANLKAFPDERVVVEGFAEQQETNPRTLAKRRAEAIVDLLISEHGIPADRLSAVGRDPEGSGESARKAVAFFLGRGGN